jgi:hypothetical protein
MAIGLSSNPENIKAKDRQMLVGPPVDSNPDGGGAPAGVQTDNDTLGDLTPTKGRIVVGNGTAWVILEPGPQGYVLMVDSAEAVGVKWGLSTSPDLYAFDERDLWLYGWDADLLDEVLLNLVLPEYWLFEDLP